VNRTHSILTASTQVAVSCTIKDLRMTTSLDPQFTPLSRRGVLTGAAAVGGAAVLGASLVACGSDSDPEPPAGSAGPTTVKVADVPVGGGTIIAASQVVVTQPSAGEFKAFSAICTHQNCVVARVQNGAIDCTCHNSKFSATDGSVLNGPANRPLTAKEVTVAGDSLTIT
jgi:Rieske Fe-S protein